MKSVNMSQTCDLPQRQQGMVLLVGLIMVLLISVISLAAIRSSGLQESMAGNMRDKNLAFQAAEAGLREGEDVLNQATLPAFDGSSTGYYTELDGSTTTGYWDSYNWDNSDVADVTLGEVAESPRFVIEEVTYTVVAGSEGGAIDFASTLKAEDATLYRVTSLGTGGSENATAILQSTFKR